MKHIIVLLFIALVTSSCKKVDSDPHLVANFIKAVKEHSYREFNLRNFNVGHVDALFQHASDEQRVLAYPQPWYSSHHGGLVEAGVVVLYAIEAIRLQMDWPQLKLIIFDLEDPQRVVPLSEVLPIYQTWWAQHKGKSATQLRQLDPLEGTGLAWHGTSIAH